MAVDSCCAWWVLLASFGMARPRAFVLTLSEMSGWHCHRCIHPTDIVSCVLLMRLLRASRCQWVCPLLRLSRLGRDVALAGLLRGEGALAVRGRAQESLLERGRAQESLVERAVDG